MAIEITRFDTATLLGVMREVEPPSNYWLQFFPSQVNFTDEYIDFSQISESRQIAPLVVPTAQGKPIYAAAEKATRVKPAYVKPKDTVTATRVIKRVAGFGELATGATAMSPAQRYNAIIADILAQHRKAIERRWEWLASQAIQFGKVTLESDDYPKTVVDFERNLANTTTLTGGSVWGAAGVSILRNVESWKSITRKARFGGVSNRLTVGASAWDMMRENLEIRQMLGQDLRLNNSGLNLNLGMKEGLDIEYVGKLSGTTEVWVYADYYETETGTVVDFMDPRDVVLTGPSIAGVRAFGAIQDKNAGFQALEMFPKMWDAEDPSATFVMTQSAPLMIPVNVNASFRARVLA